MQPPSACLASGVSSASMSSTVIVSWPLICPTNRMSAAMFSGSPHSTRGTTSDRTDRQITSEAADEASGTRTANHPKTAVSIADRLSDGFTGQTSCSWPMSRASSVH